MNDKNQMRHIYTGTTEHIDLTISAPVDLTGTVELRFGTGSWITGSWLGAGATAVGTTYQRQARFLINSGNTPAAAVYDLFTRVTASPVAPIMPAGKATVH